MLLMVLFSPPPPLSLSLHRNFFAVDVGVTSDSNTVKHAQMMNEHLHRRDWKYPFLFRLEPYTNEIKP